MKFLKIFTDFADALEPLSDAECGRLFKAMLAYTERGSEPDFRGNERFIWPMAKSQMDRMAAAYDKKADISRANGAKGGRPSKNEEKPGETQKNQKNPVGFLETQKNPENPNCARKEKKRKENSRGVDNILRTREECVENLLKEDIDSCFRKFFDRPPTEFEISRLFDCYQTAHMEDGALSFEIKYTADDAQLMANAFECAASAGSMGVAYVAGVLRNFRERGIKTEADRVRWEGERYEVFNS